jgi:hypothetical protein
MANVLHQHHRCGTTQIRRLASSTHGVRRRSRGARCPHGPRGNSQNDGDGKRRPNPGRRPLNVAHVPPIRRRSKASGAPWQRNVCTMASPRYSQGAVALPAVASPMAGPALAAACRRDRPDGDRRWARLIARKVGSAEGTGRVAAGEKMNNPTRDHPGDRSDDPIKPRERMVAANNIYACCPTGGSPRAPITTRFGREGEITGTPMPRSGLTALSAPARPWQPGRLGFI